MRDRRIDRWVALGAMARRAPGLTEADEAPPGFATRVVARWRAARQEDPWLRMAPRFAVPALALALLAIAAVGTGPVVPDDPGVATARQLNELFLGL
ncbi:MAG: hypothetical protein IT577_23615 [Verrucomicrobiae bacterium]|nr:hypothetical protein [Verrucomicrobiae bacterium]